MNQHLLRVHVLPWQPAGKKGSLGFEATLPVVLSQQPLPAFPMLPGKKGTPKRSGLLPPLKCVGWLWVGETLLCERQVRKENPLGRAVLLGVHESPYRF